LDRYVLKTEVVIPLSIENQPFGFIELIDVNEERIIEDEELFTWGNVAGQVSIAIQNTQLLDRVQRKLNEQKARIESSEVILSSLDINFVLAQITEQMCSALNLTSAYISVFNSEGLESTVIAEYISSEAAPEEAVSDIGETYSFFDDSLFINKLQSNSHDISQINDPEITEEEIAHMEKYGAKSILFIPLIIKKKLIGFTELWESRYIREFTQDEVSLCIDISNKAAIAIENARLYQKSLKEIKKHRITQAALRKSERYYRGLFDNAHDAIVIFDPLDDRVLDVNPQACDLFGYPLREFINLKIFDLSKNIAQLKMHVSKTLKRGRHTNLESIGNKKDGSEMHLEINSSLVEHEGTKVILSSFRDITFRKEIEEQLIHYAMHDDLTGLPNRNLFLDHVDKALARKSRNKSFNFVVIFFDLDNFKNINDTLGHSVGDLYLKSLASSLSQVSRKVDTLARFGGDEFAILIESLQDPIDIDSYCNRILSILRSKIPVENKNITSTASIGIVHGDTSYTSPEDIIRDADIAMYKAKEKGGNNFEVFDENLRNQWFHQLTLESGIEEALSNNEFTLFYQPIVSLSDGSIFGLEALIRWQKPGEGLVYPKMFIPFAEKSGIIKRIDEWVINTGIQQILEWNSQVPNFSGMTVSFNISNAQLEYMQFSDELLVQLKKSNLDTGRLSLEITESVFIHNIDKTAKNLELLRNHGMQIFLDDFGTGYSSLSYLIQLPIHILKVDQTFIKDVTRTNNLNLLRSVMNVGKDLGLKVVAEGIETVQQFKMLRNMGCDLGQGYFIQKPVDADTATRLLHKGVIYPLPLED
jgi:diguanylate cyclase (GGDEF)-like protein/PAS domain S-box-containing protein